MPIDSEGLRKIKCPNCGQAMSHGYIAGKAAHLRWTEKEKTYTILAGSKLRRKLSWLGAPNVEATRCEECKIGLFRYDY